MDEWRGVRVTGVAWDHPDAVAMRAAMTAEMSAVYADREVPGSVLTVDDDTVVWTGLAVDADGAVAGHAALRTSGADVELKRMFVAATHRGRGVAGALVEATHAAALALGHHRVVLQTGDRQPDAVRVYERAGYTPIPVFPPYDRISFSICMAVDLP